MKSAHPFSKKVGRKLKEERERRGLSQERLAFKAKITRNFISMIERGESNVTISKIHDIANAMGMEAWELLKF